MQRRRSPEAVRSLWGQANVVAALAYARLLTLASDVDVSTDFVAVDVGNFVPGGAVLVE